MSFLKIDCEIISYVNGVLRIVFTYNYTFPQYLIKAKGKGHPVTCQWRNGGEAEV